MQSLNALKLTRNAIAAERIYMTESNPKNHGGTRMFIFYQPKFILSCGAFGISVLFFAAILIRKISDENISLKKFPRKWKYGMRQNKKKR